MIICFNYLITKRQSLQLDFTNHHKEDSGKYLIDLNFPNVEWCKNVAGMRTNPFFESLLNAAKVIGKDLLEFCNRTGEMILANVSFANVPLVTGWPSGDYKTVYRFYDDLDDNIYNVSHFSIIKH